jgi:RNA polymerase sigma factor (sigma-70 family)
MSEMDDLVKRLAVDLNGAFPDLVRSMQSEVYAGLRSLAGSEAEDLAQETFIRAYRALNEYGADRIRDLRLRGWIWTIALNLGRNHMRDRARRPLPVADSPEPAVSDPEPADSRAWRERLALLPNATRRAVVLRHVVGLGYDEIAAVVGRPEGTVKSDVHRGIQRLREIMETEQ